jgi:hypothetical protein
MEALSGSWPLALVICVIVFLAMFYRPIATLIGRAKRAGYGDKSIDFGESAAEAQKKAEEPAAITADTVPAGHAMPPASEVYAPIEQEIRAAFANLKLPPELERAWLTRMVATLRVVHAHENVYRLIMGSQLTLLTRANTATPPDMEAAEALYDEAKAAFPDTYANFDFNNWFRYPVNVGLLRIDDGGLGRPTTLRITPAGRDFLHYLVASGLTMPKPG